jgi:hypothetical protein
MFRLLAALGAATAVWSGLLEDSTATVTAGSADDVRAAIVQAQQLGSLNIRLEEGTHLELNDGPIAVAGIRLCVFSSGEGATIDAMQRSRAFIVSDGGSLILEHLHVTGGVAPWTNDWHGCGCILALAGCNLTLSSAQLSHCVADGRGQVSQAELAVPSAHGGGISSHGGIMSLTRSVIAECQAVDGGALFATGEMLYAEECVFRGCTSEREAGCLPVLGEARAAIRHTRLDGCACGAGGGAIFAADRSQLLLEDSMIVACTAGRDGGAIALLDASAYVRDSELLSCSAGQNGGAVWLGTSNLAMYAVAVHGCDASDGGGGLFLEMGEVHVSDCTFDSCSAVEMGGGLTLRAGSVQLRSVLIVGCWSGRDVGGVAIRAGTVLVMRACTFRECWVADIRGLGSAIVVEQNGEAILQRSTVERCHSEMYATLYSEGNLTLSDGSEVRDCTARDSGVSVSSEDSRRGGVLWVRRGGGARLLHSTISDCHVLDLSTPQTYFAVASVEYRGTLELFHSTFWNNTVRSVTDDGASAVFVHRGGVLTSGGLEIQISCDTHGIQSILAEGNVQRRADAPPPPVHRSVTVDGFEGEFVFAQLMGYADPVVELFDFRASVVDGCEEPRSAAQIQQTTVGSGQLLQACGSAPGMCDELSRCTDEPVVRDEAGQRSIAPTAEPPYDLFTLSTVGDNASAQVALVPVRLTSPACVCPPPTTPALGVPDASLAPYLPAYGCATPRYLSDITVLEQESGARIAHVVLTLTKTTVNDEQSVALRMHMGGTQRASAAWSVDRASVPRWLSVSPLAGLISPDERSAAFVTITASSKGMPERLEPYAARLNVSVSTGAAIDIVALPIYTIIAATASLATSMWGEPQHDGTCRPTQQTEPLHLVLHSSTPPRIFFSACDREGLVVQHSLSSTRTAKAIELSPRGFRVAMRCEMTGQTDEFLYMYVAKGRYAVPLYSRKFEDLTGQFTLKLELDDEPCGCGKPAGRHLHGPPGEHPSVGCAEIAVLAVCPDGLVEMADRTCGCDGMWLGYRKQAGVCVPEVWPLLLICIGSVASVLLVVSMCVCARRAYRIRKLALAAAARERREQRRRVCEAMRDATVLKFPLCVMPLSSFRRSGSLVAYEQARDGGMLRCCDSWEEASRFASRCPLIFISHQWLSRASLDPHGVHYPRMVRAAEALCDEHGLDLERAHIRFDYHSIPQHNDATKALANGSIAFYAACTSYFMVCAPDSTHVDSGLRCDSETYLARNWCRLEQWAIMTANGVDSMYYCGVQLVDGQPRLMPIVDVARWVERSIKVFSGDFTCEEDKRLLVDVVLGMYGLAYVSMLQREASADGALEADGCRAAGLRRTQMQGGLVGELQAANKETIFPRHLFGDLVELLEAELEAAIAKVSGLEGMWHLEAARRHVERKGPQYGRNDGKGGESKPAIVRSHSYALFDRDGFEAVLQASSHLYKCTPRSLKTSSNAAHEETGSTPPSTRRWCTDASISGGASGSHLINQQEGINPFLAQERGHGDAWRVEHRRTHRDAAAMEEDVPGGIISVATV